LEKSVPHRPDDSDMERGHLHQVFIDTHLSHPCRVCKELFVYRHELVDYVDW
jgi:hypothetical protein